jgi:hypothetical protein
MKNLVGIIFIVLFVSLSFAEMPQISLEKFIKEAQFVVSGEPVKSRELDITLNCSYAIWTFKIDKVYKGDAKWPGVDSICISESNEIIKGKFASVLVLSNPNHIINIPHADVFKYIQPRYCEEICSHFEIGKKYILFLSMIEDSLYIRTDKILFPKAWNKQAEKQVKMVVERLIDIEKGKPGDFISYRIPKNAKAVNSSNDGSGYFNYRLGDENAGYREIEPPYGIVYEMPMKCGMRYGVSWTCDSNGKRMRLETYLDDAEHGVLRIWDESGQLTEGYYVYGYYVSKEEYLEKCKTDVRLEQSLKLKWEDVALDKR